VIPGQYGLAMAMVLGAVLLTPVGVAGAGGDLLDVRVLAAGLGVAVLSSAIPYALELEALRRMPARVFGILLSLEPAMAALAGLVILSEGLRARDVLAIVLVGVASAGASLTAARGTAAPEA
jgi:inner membrane transporter RhtA